MDLLGGYGSDSSAASSTSSKEDSAPTPTPAATTNTTNIKSKPQPKKKQQRITKKGRKLISLNAVLPPAIFERLARHADDDHASDSSDEEETLFAKKPTTTTKNKNPKKVIKGKDQDLNDMLRELQSAPVLTTTAALSSSSSDTPKKKEKETLGMAFFNVKTTSTTAKEQEVVDVHASSTATGKITEHEDMKQNVKSSSAPAPPARATNITSTIPRPTTNTIRKPSSSIQAAPGLNRTINTAATNNSTTYNNYNEAEEQHPNDNNDESEQTTSKKRKRSTRKELDRALRSGDFSSMSNSNSQTMTTHEQSQTISNYIPSTEQMTATNIRSAEIQSLSGGGGARQVKMYDPKTGQDVHVSEITNKHRSKHQINQLMASAASYQVKRDSGWTGTGSGTVKGSSTRVSAKKKYGW
mmetsp:Transcript_6538/g.9898  ORF Transcript_6538/g.9898 Transcript_6538/m.9898 type:complete len:412 (-) Transcript_6538:236-1471(-)